MPTTSVVHKTKVYQTHPSMMACACMGLGHGRHEVRAGASDQMFSQSSDVRGSNCLNLAISPHISFRAILAF